MPRPGAWATANREKLREYSRAYRKAHPEYFKKYEASHGFRLKILRRLWQRKNRKHLTELNRKYWTQEQRREYQRAWRAKRKEDKGFMATYLNSLTT